MRMLTICLTMLVVLIQYPLWLGKGSWSHVWDLQKQVQAAQQKNQEAKLRNVRTESEVRDLKEGTAASEERARNELGMVKPGETFYRVVDPHAAKLPEEKSAEENSQ